MDKIWKEWNSNKHNSNKHNLNNSKLKSRVFNLTGPVLLYNSISHYKLTKNKEDIFITPKKYFYSILISMGGTRIKEIRDSIEEVKKVAGKDAYAVSYWTGIWCNDEYEK